MLTDEQSNAIDAVCKKLTPTQAIDLGDHIQALRSIQWDLATVPADAPAVHRMAEQEPNDPHLVKLLRNVCHYADRVCGMLRSGGWPGKAEALESRIKAVIEYDTANPFKTHAPEGISYDHLLELAKMSGLVGAYSVKAVNDKIVGYARVVLNDVAVQEAFVRANWAAPLPRTSDAAALTEEDVERQYRDGVHVGSGLPRGSCPCGFCAKHRHGFNQGDAATRSAEPAQEVAQGDERAAFEAWWASTMPKQYRADALRLIAQSRQGDGEYGLIKAQEAWEGWQARATALQATAPAGFFDVVFDGPPSRESGRFVEVEDEQGRSFEAGEWIDRGDGLWALRIARSTPQPATMPPLADAMRAVLRNERCVYGSEDELYAALCEAAQADQRMSDVDGVLCAAVDRFDALMSSLDGCTDGGCVISPPKGMHTNGGCRCVRNSMKMQRAMFAAKGLRDAIDAARAASSTAEIERKGGAT